MDEFLADNEQLSEYSRQLAENERSNQELQNYFNMLLEPNTCSVFHWILTPDLSTWKLPTTVTKITLSIKDT